jgi:glycogen debranching enzyme
MMREGYSHHEQPESKPNEEILEEVSLALPERHMSALKAILDLTAATSPSEIGLHGPSNASNTSEENRNVPELNLYSEFYPRDSHVVALFLEKQHPNLTKATVLASLAYAGMREHLRSSGGLQDEQEFGKVPHEIRDTNTPKAQQRAIEKDRTYPYYGAIDTTGKNINAITRISLDNTPHSLDFLTTSYMGLDGKEHTVEDALQSHINWIRKRMDLNPEGLLESLWINQKHHANQSWADSPDSFHHADGSWARHHPDKNWGVAALEVQAETYDALQGVINIYSEQLKQENNDRRKIYLLEEIADLTKRAERLQGVVLDAFWVEDPQHSGGYFARGTDRDEQGGLRPLAIRSSDMGHLLYSKILDGDNEEVRTKREATIQNIFSPEMLSPNGIRSLATDSVRYRDDAYHNGSSWPWQTYYTALGLERHGYYGLSNELKKRIWSFYNETKTLAEYGTGSSDPHNRINTNRQITVFDPSLYSESIYHFSRHKIVQPPQQIQAWSAAAILAMKYEYGNRFSQADKSLPSPAIDPYVQLLENKILSRISEEGY